MYNAPDLKIVLDGMYPLKASPQFTLALEMMTAMHMRTIKTYMSTINS